MPSFLNRGSAAVPIAKTDKPTKFTTIFVKNKYSKKCTSSQYRVHNLGTPRFSWLNWRTNVMGNF